MPRTGQSLTSQPVSGRALLKLLKDDVAQQAAMAALLCESAGWTQLSALLSLLSADAAAGSRPELRELLRVRLASTAELTCSQAHPAVPSEVIHPCSLHRKPYWYSSSGSKSRRHHNHTLSTKKSTQPCLSSSEEVSTSQIARLISSIIKWPHMYLAGSLSYQVYSVG